LKVSKRKYGDAANISLDEPMQRIVEGIIDFTANQAIKTIRRPSRLIFIGLRCLVSIMIYPAFVSAFLARRLGFPISWIPKVVLSLEATYHFRRGERLLRENKPEKAWCALERSVKYGHHHFHYTIAAVCLHVGLGRMREAIELYQQSNRLRLEQRSPIYGGEYDKYCLLDFFWIGHIGHAAQIDYVVKLLMLERRDPSNTILYVPPADKVPNRFFVEQWRPHLRLITDVGNLPFPAKYGTELALDFYVPGVSGIGKYYLWELAAQTYRRWAEEGRKPLLKLAEEVRDRGRAALASAGVPVDAWFVGLHVREPQYQRHHRGLHDVLNAKIEDYLPAIDEIVRRGGWVIRMGDPSMTPLPPLPNVLDYCHSAIRSDWMDIFLAATSRFFIGTSSGVCYVAQDYGVPCVLTNWWPPAQRPWHAGDIFIPKLLRRSASGQVLSLEESLNEPFGYCNSVDYLREKHGVTVQDNHPEDIRVAVVEMLDRVDGRPNYDQNDIAMRECAEGIYASVAMRLYDSPAAFGAANLACGFLRRNPSLLEM
jgi:putative glycosyltransferase (TIGR04372 family)